MIKVEVQRSGNMQSVLSRLEKQLGEKVERGVMAVAKGIYLQSQDLVPDDTGYLKFSGRKYLFETGIEAGAAVGYGGTDFPEQERVSKAKGSAVKVKPSRYAVAVHQGAVHYEKPRNGKSFFFLQRAYLEHMESLKQLLRTAAER